MNKKTLVLGATPNPERYAYKAVERLKQHGFPVVGVGIQEGKIGDTVIQTRLPAEKGVHTVSLYIGRKNQPPYYEYLLSLQPVRMIFNPGTENPELVQKAQALGIETIEACTLVMLAAGQF